MNDNKVFVIGIDGMDPKMTRRMVDEGKLPKFIRKYKGNIGSFYRVYPFGCTFFCMCKE